jgi:hypothetical protein
MLVCLELAQTYGVPGWPAAQVSAEVRHAARHVACRHAASGEVHALCDCVGRLAPHFANTPGGSEAVSSGDDEADGSPAVPSCGRDGV